ncbi:MAG: hypothetical protein CL702_12140 [Chloroflexi bacterium]|jgi:uncharacterized protein (DUF1501 family)|nr:hypothetical protein [Chloroflexota bacterium]MAZ64575.1 hypothetical protein [Dehalococcoidia bacterium]MEC9279262.1 DUF1501 domain-containing protein [Chloroflexota bacterium]MED5569585.1 DUF1501 domain-containing protein [Chloroflexota bacterium]|tara:strand:- start:989 stop:2125 length:1137 start_codon:yes stop_codon:yes gene_type:complete
MASTHKDPVLVVLELTGANDYLNTIVPYSDPLYWDNRKRVNIGEDQLLIIDDELAFRSDTEPLKEIYDNGNMAIIHGIGFGNSPRSHFRAMDIWHTCEPDSIGINGWLGKVIRHLDPSGENVLKGVNLGQGLPRAMTMRGVPVTSVNHLPTYGVLSSNPGIESDQDRVQMLESFARMYAPAIGTGPTMDYLGQAGRDALRGADIIRVAPETYSSTVEYANNPIARRLRDVAQVHLAGLGTQVFYTAHGPFDTHFDQLGSHTKIWQEVSGAISNFFDDLREHNAGDEVVLMVFSEFGRRVRDNGTGTDHGAGGVAFAIGNRVNGGMYGTYPSLKPENLSQGDLAPNYDFRGFYSTLADKWLGLDPVPIVGGNFEQMSFV